ncbi:ABC transporter permease [Acetanaerobacterium elongatum]|uniref:ABC-2 type transport system permease protein n=1 Tax=Acetanaerobacterium elongatum TaxID=258515 RepID=A0A1H0C676_9FIRM|nr:ABC transporter permease [Acetanaerobacterium elongatum]SDN53394.1 ABC-2 type transport system permease protein [Acetanaerobacterium elongatum]
MKTFNIIKRIIKQIFNDKRSLALILLVPLFIFTLIYFLLGDSDYTARIAEADMPAPLVDELKEQNVTVTSLTVDEGREQVKSGQADALLYKEDGTTHLLLETNDATKAGIVQKAVTSAMKELSPGSAMETEFIYGNSDDTLFNSLGYVMLGIVSFFIIFIIAGISFVRERTNQTMERLMMTPVRRWQVVLGYTLGFGFFAILQSIVLLTYDICVLGFAVAGSVITAGLITILLAMSAVCIGAFFSIFSNNEFQMMQFIPIVVIPQIFFSGIISLDTLPYHLGEAAKIFPVYYACDALKAVTIRGAGPEKILPDITALLVFILLFFVMNILALKKYRRI